MLRNSGLLFSNKTASSDPPISFTAFLAIALLPLLLLSGCGGGSGSSSNSSGGGGLGGGAYSAPNSRTRWAHLGSTVEVGDDNEAPLQLVVHDRTHGTIFVSNPGLNEVLAYDQNSKQLKAKVDISFPLGMDLSPDGQSLYVGSATNFLFVIDPGTLHVKQKINTVDILPPGGFSAVSVFTLTADFCSCLLSGWMAAAPSSPGLR